MAITMQNYVLLDGLTAWSLQHNQFCYVIPQNQAATTSRIFIVDHMHQDVTTAPSTVNTQMILAGLVMHTYTMIDGATIAYINEAQVSSIEPRTSQITRIHFEGHWILEVRAPYATVLADLT